MKKWIVQGSAPVSIPTIHILSDSVGATGQGVARAAAASFGVLSPSEIFLLQLACWQI